MKKTIVNREPKNDKLLFVCRCGSHNHHIIISLDDELKEVYATIHLNTHSFFKRVWYGLKYIFGYRSEYGDFAEFIFDENDIWKLELIIDNLTGKSNF